MPLNPYVKDTWADFDPTKPVSAARMTNLETQYDAAMADAAVLYGADVRAWAPNTVYAAGQAVVSPTTGDVVTSKTAHTSGATFSGTGASGNWNLSTTFQKQIPPSGDTSGATDLAAINAAPNAVLQGGGVYYVNGPIVRPSNSYLRAFGATIHLVTGGTNLLRNAAVAPTRTVADAVTTANSSTVTSATAAFTSADVGSMVGVISAALGGATWYGSITAVNSATSVTLNTPADLALTGATLQVFANRDTNIVIEGGTWILDVAPADGHQTTSTAFNSFATMFRRVTGLRLRDTAWSVPGASGQGGKFTVSLADVSDFIVSGTHFIQTAGDGVHVMGPASYGVIQNTTGTSGDDMVVLSCGDQNTPYITDTQGALTAVLTNGIVTNGSWSAYKLYDLGAGKRFAVTGCHVDDISGWTRVQVVQLISLMADHVEVSRVSATPGGSNPVVDFLSCTYSTSMSVRDIQYSGTAASNGVVRLTQPRNAFKISNIMFTSATSGTNIAVNIASGAVNGSGFGLTTLDIDGVYTPNQVNGTATTFATVHVLAINGTGTGDSTATIRNVSVASTNGLLVNKATVCPFSRIEIAHSVFAGLAVIATPTGDSNTSLVLSNTKATVTNIAVIRSPMDAHVTGLRSACSGAAFTLAGAGATPVRLRVGTYNEAGTGGGISRDSTQAVSVNGVGLPVDVSILTPTDGDIAHNSNAALGCGVGPAVYNTTAAKWKGLYSGATN